MPTLELSDEQVFALLQQLSETQKKRVIEHLFQPKRDKAKPKFGSAKNDIVSISDDFDAPLEDFAEYI